MDQEKNREDQEKQNRAMSIVNAVFVINSIDLAPQCKTKHWTWYLPCVVIISTAKNITILPKSDFLTQWLI